MKQLKDARNSIMRVRISRARGVLTSLSSLCLAKKKVFEKQRVNMPNAKLSENRFPGIK